jgi:fumarate reductase subunit C
LLFHSVTWLNLAPKAMSIRVRGRRIADGLIALGHYAAWLAASAFVTWLLSGR